MSLSGRISKLLFDISNKEAKKTEEGFYQFSGKNLPSITIFEYIERFSQYCSDEILIAGIIYIDRLTMLNPQIILHQLNIHRICLVSFMLAMKFNQDKQYTSKFYAQLGGVSIKELNSLESLFLDLIKYELFISKDQFITFMDLIIPYNEDVKEKSAEYVYQNFNVLYQTLCLMQIVYIILCLHIQTFLSNLNFFLLYQSENSLLNLFNISLTETLQLLGSLQKNTILQLFKDLLNVSNIPNILNQTL